MKGTRSSVSLHKRKTTVLDIVQERLMINQGFGFSQYGGWEEGQEGLTRKSISPALF